LSTYYKAQRKNDAHMPSTGRTTLRLLESLIRLAKAHARLMAQQEATVRDAVMAIMLVEMSMNTFNALGQESVVNYDFPVHPEAEFSEMQKRVLKDLKLEHFLDDDSNDNDNGGGSGGGGGGNGSPVASSDRWNNQNSSMMPPPNPVVGIARPTRSYHPETATSQQRSATSWAQPGIVTNTNDNITGNDDDDDDDDDDEGGVLLFGGYDSGGEEHAVGTRRVTAAQEPAASQQRRIGANSTATRATPTTLQPGRPTSARPSQGGSNEIVLDTTEERATATRQAMPRRWNNQTEDEQEMRPPANNARDALGGGAKTTNGVAGVLGACERPMSTQFSTAQRKRDARAGRLDKLFAMESDDDDDGEEEEFDIWAA
jgi:hypothetical protein